MKDQQWTSRSNSIVDAKSLGLWGLIMPATTGMKGAGYYDQHSTAQVSTIQALSGWVEAAVVNPAPQRAARLAQQIAVFADDAVCHVRELIFQQVPESNRT